MDAKNADVVFKAFAGADLPDAKLRQAMIDDVVGMLDYYTWTAPSGIASLFTSDLGVRPRRAPGEALRRARPGTAPATPPALPAGQRPGLLTRALFLVDRQREHAPDHEGRVPAPEHPVRHDPAAAAGRQRQAARAGPGHDDARERRGDHRDARDGLRRLPPARPSTRSASRPRGSMRSAASARRSACSTPPASRPAPSR